MTDIIESVIDAAVTYQTPEAYMIGTVLIGFLVSILMAGIYAKAAYDDMLKEKGLTKSDCPFGADYMIMIVVIGALGAFAGYFASGILLGLMGQQDAPGMVYYAVAFVSAICVGKYGWGFLANLPDIIRNKLKILAGADSSDDS